MRKLLLLIAAALVALAATAAVALADGPPATATVHVGGTITAVGSGSIGLKVEKAGPAAAALVGQTVTIGVDASTQITVGKDAGTLADLKVGARAAVQATGGLDALVATKIHATKGDGSHQGQHGFGGAVTGVGSDSLTIVVDRTGKHDTGLMGQTVTVSVPAGTPITLGEDKKPIGLGDIKVGYRAGVQATQDATSGAWTASKVHVGLGDHWFAGAVTAVGSDSFTVAVSKTGKYDTQLNGTTVVVPVDGSTQFVVGEDKKPGTLGDLKTGDHVGVLVHAPGGDLTKGFTAVKVHIRHAKDAASPAAH